MKAENLLHLTLEENGYEEFVTKGSGFSQTIVESMERYAKDYHESKVKKLNKPVVVGRSEQLKALDYLANKGITGQQAKTIAEWMEDYKSL